MKLPIISGTDVVKALSKVGFVMTRQSGSHMILVNSFKEKITELYRNIKSLQKELY